MRADRKRRASERKRFNTRVLMMGWSMPAVLNRLFRARQPLRTLCGEDTREDPQI